MFITLVRQFLSDRKQRVKVGKSISKWVSVHAGVPQGSKLEPILFLVIIIDLAPPNSNYWSFVDDGTFLRMFQNLLPQTSSLT